MTIAPRRKDFRVHQPKFRSGDSDEPIQNRDTLAILGFDPGGTTGWSLLTLPTILDGRDVFSWRLNIILENAISWEHGELNTNGEEDASAYHMAKMCKSQPTAAIVIEDFILRVERKEKSRELLSPVRLTAKLDAHLWMLNRKAFKQDPSQGKRVTDDRLSILGALVDDGLTDHARDADRHVVMFVRRCIGLQGKALRNIAWPYLYCCD